MGEYRKTLADRVLAAEFSPERWGAGLDLAMLGSSPVVDVSDVTEFFFAGTAQEDWGPEHYPNLAPPFPLFWLETRAPSHIESDRFGAKPWSAPARRWGALVRATTELHPLMPAPAKWTCLAVPFFETTSSDLVVGPLPAVLWSVDESGSWVVPTDQDPSRGGDDRRAGGAFRYLIPRIPGVPREMYQEIGDEGARLMKPLMLAISFMHCKNVSLHQEAPPPAALSNRNKERHGMPLVRRYTLDIKPMRRTLEAEGRSREVGAQRALHLCRGHFKDYREGAGLFGRNKGLYWWEANVRGSIEGGIVAKDYAVKAARDGEGKP
jgi:hypothetical protein